VKKIILLVMAFCMMPLYYGRTAVYDAPGHSKEIYDSDIRVLEKKLSSEPDNTAALEQIIKLLFANERFQETVIWCDRYRKKNHSLQIEYIRTMALAATGRYDEAIAAARKIVDDPLVDASWRRDILNKISVYEKGLKSGGFPAGGIFERWGSGASVVGVVDRDKVFVGINAASGTPVIYSYAKGNLQDESDRFYLSGLDRNRIMAISVSPDGREVFATLFGSGNSIIILHRSFDVMKEKWSQWSAPGFASEGSINGYANMLGDGEHLLFVSNRNRAAGLDIYVTVRDSKGSWSRPEPVTNANTVMDECSLFIHPDGETVYFSSNGRGGAGGFDLFAGTLSSLDGRFSINGIVNLARLNSYRNETSPLYVSGDIEKALYTFRINDGLSVYDARGYERQPKPVLFLDCTILDAATKQPVTARVHLLRSGDKTSGITLASDTDRKGVAPFTIRRKSRYSAEVVAQGYSYHTETIESPADGDLMKKTILISKGKVQAGFTFTAENIYFEIGLAQVKAESLPELERLMQFMKNNQGVRIEIAGFTDNTGDIMFNLDLSQRRAESVAVYLYDRGIDRKRVVAKGYGAERPVMSNDTDEGRRKNRRVEIKVLSSE
jgi:outer membrane protein OmpA-like peptidoglycan-associated protein